MILKIKTLMVLFFCIGTLAAQKSANDTLFIFEKLKSIELSNLSIDSALVAFEKTYFQSKKIDYQNGISRSLVKLGQLHFKNNQPSLALRYFTEAINIFEKEKNFKKLQAVQIFVSEVYLKEGLPDRAIEFLRKANTTQQ